MGGPAIPLLIGPFFPVRTSKLALYTYHGGTKISIFLAYQSFTDIPAMASSDVGALNGHSPAVRALKPGVYAPIPTFFLPHTEDLG